MIKRWQQALVWTGLFSILGMQGAWADLSPSQAERLSQRLQPAVKNRSFHITQSLVQITGVRVEAKETGLEIILETPSGQLIVPTTQIVGNAVIAEIPNAVLALPDGDSFEQFDPAEGIALVSVTNLPGERVQVAITGTDGPPKADVNAGETGLALLVVPGVAQASDGDETIQIVVTGEQDDGYNPFSATTGTRTDTPLLDIPQSIQVVPQAILRDQQITRLEDALRNVPGVNQSFNFGPLAFYTIRGFEATANNLLRDGFIDPLAGEVSELSSSTERIEVLKGPASVLFGLGNPGGTINVITKLPLSDPFYALDASIGSDSFYRGAVDLSGPLDDSKTILYRLNASYKNYGSFVDFFNGEYYNLSPVVSFAIGDKTNLIIEGEYIDSRTSYASGVPVVGTILFNPNGEVSRNSNFGEPSDEFEQKITRFGYRLEHEFNENWSLRNAFLFSSRDYIDKTTIPSSLDADDRTLNRIYREYKLENIYISLVTNVVGRFSTGSIDHQLLFGIDLNSLENFSPNYTEREAASIDIFNPVYGKSPGKITFDEFSDESQTQSLGVYLQDQITLTDNFQLLLGGRFDAFERKYEDFTNNTESSGSDSAFSPRFGIIYQPIPSLSLYASYTRSFTPPSGTFFFGVDSSLEPEYGTQYEVGVKADINDQLSMTLALYDITRTNVSTDDPNNPGFSIQVGEQNSQGIELNVTGEILPGWNIFAGYAYTDARVTEDNTFEIGNQLPNVADHSFNIWTTYEIQEGDLQGLGAGLGLFFVGERAGDLNNTYNLPSYLRTDASIFYNRDSFRVALNFKNLFNIDYFESALNSTRVYYGQPFTVQANVSWQF